eukprot:688335-Amphidinium_carterae.1
MDLGIALFIVVASNLSVDVPLPQVFEEINTGPKERTQQRTVARIVSVPMNSRTLHVSWLSALCKCLDSAVFSSPHIAMALSSSWMSLSLVTRCLRHRRRRCSLLLVVLLYAESTALSSSWMSSSLVATAVDFAIFFLGAHC